MLSADACFVTFFPTSFFCVCLFLNVWFITPQRLSDKSKGTSMRFVIVTAAVKWSCLGMKDFPFCRVTAVASIRLKQPSVIERWIHSGSSLIL